MKMIIPEMKVLGYRALVQLDHITESDLEIPDGTQADKTEGTVVIVGSGDKPMPVKVGDRVWMTGYGLPPRKIGNEQYALVSIEDIFAVLPEKSRILKIK